MHFSKKSQKNLFVSNNIKKQIGNHSIFWWSFYPKMWVFYYQKVLVGRPDKVGPPICFSMLSKNVKQLKKINPDLSNSLWQVYKMSKTKKIEIVPASNQMHSLENTAFSLAVVFQLSSLVLSLLRIWLVSLACLNNNKKQKQKSNFYFSIETLVLLWFHF